MEDVDPFRLTRMLSVTVAATLPDGDGDREAVEGRGGGGECELVRWRLTAGRSDSTADSEDVLA